MGSYVWDTGTFGLFTCLAVCNLEQFGRMCLVFPQKWQTHKGLSCFLSLGMVGFLGLDSLRSTLVFLGGVLLLVWQSHSREAQKKKQSLWNES